VFFSRDSNSPWRKLWRHLHGGSPAEHSFQSLQREGHSLQAPPTGSEPLAPLYEQTTKSPQSWEGSEQKQKWQWLHRNCLKHSQRDIDRDGSLRTIKACFCFRKSSWVGSSWGIRNGRHKGEPGVMVCTWNPSYARGRGKRTVVWVQLWAKIQDTMWKIN
jgi:hypothetical protein